MPQNGFDYLPPQQHLMAMKLAIAEAAVKMKSKMGWEKGGKKPTDWVLMCWEDGGKRKASWGQVLFSTFPDEG